MTCRGRAALPALLIITLVASALLAPVAAAAQGPAPVIETAELRLWPEYDDPGLLVIFSGTFTAGTTFPLTIALPIPADARNVQATYQDASGALINRPFEIANGKLTYEIPAGAFHVEYYLDRAPSGDGRQIAHVFEAPYAINALRVAVQQPARSSAFTLTPTAESVEQGSDGLTYHIFNRNNLAAGETLDITIAYTKTDTGLSAPQLAVTSTDAAAGATQPVVATATSATDWLPWVLIGVGAALLVGIGVYWLLSRRAPAPTPAAPAGTPRAGARPPAPRPTVPARTGDAPRPPAGPAAFCVNCGNALKPDDRFCSQCGAPRRT